jgi:hypothetical protein
MFTCLGRFKPVLQQSDMHVCAGFAALLFLLVACAPKPVVIPAGADHPADPVAQTAPLPSRSETLSSMPVEKPPQPAGMQGGHHMHH